VALTFDVFLSHNGQDKPAVEQIAERLRRAGLRPWLDKWELTPGGRWQDELHEGLQQCRAFAYFLGPNGEGDWAREELDAARSRAAKDREFRIFPVLLPGTADPFDRTTMPPFLGHRTWVDLRRGIDDARGIQAFINAVKGVPLGAPADAAPAPAGEDRPPYRGLDAFDEADAAWFFGREPDIQQLLEQLKGSRFLAVLGPSGSGKSSLVRAGLVPALRAGALPGSGTWPIEIVKPGARPAEAIAARLLTLGGGGAGGAAGMQATLDGLLGDARTLHLATTLALGDAPDRRLVWVIDQAEEVFTLCHDEAERRAVIDNLAYAATVPGGRTVVVLAMRADFYARAAAYPDLAALISRSQHLVGPLTPDGIRDAIEEPARTAGLEFEEGLIGQILDDLEGQPGSLPLLQYALLELWKRRRGSMLTLEGYRESGGVQGAIAQRAESIYASFTPDEQAIARRALLRLTQPGEGTEDTRRRAALRELVTRQDEQREVEAVIGELTDARLLTASADPATGEGLVDISHEALIRAWPRVRQWLDEDRAGQRVLRRITEAAAEWIHLGRDDGLLFRGARLAEAVEWREAHDAQLNEDERAFLDASVALATRERTAKERARRRVTVAAGALAAVFLVLAGLAGLQWLNAEDERRTAEEQRIAAEQQRALADEQRQAAEAARTEADRRAAEAEEARTQAEAARREALGRAVAFQSQDAEQERDRALLLAIEASRRSDSPEVRSLLLRQLTAEPRLVRFLGAPGAAVTHLDVRAAPGLLAWIDAEGVARVVGIDDPDTVRLEARAGEGIGAGVSLAADGSTLAAAVGRTVTLWSVADGQQQWQVEVPSPSPIVQVKHVAGEPARIAVATNDGAVRLLDAATGAVVAEPIPPETPVDAQAGLVTFAISFNEDGTQLARGEQDGGVGIWDVRTGEAIVPPFRRPPQEPPLPDLPFTVQDIAWSPVGGQLAVLYSDGFGVLSLQEAEPQQLGPLSPGVGDALRIAYAGFGGEGGFLVGSANRGLRLLPFSSFNQLTWEPVSARQFPIAIDTLEGTGRLVAGYPDGRLAIYDFGDRYPLATRLPVTPPVGGPLTMDQANTIRRDGAVMAWYEQAGNRIRLQDPTGSALPDVAVPEGSFVEAIALSDDGTRVVTAEARANGASYDSRLVVRTLPDGAVIHEEPLGPWGYRIALSPDGRQLLIGDARGALWLRDLLDGGVIWQAPADPERRAITAVELDDDGRTIRAGVTLGTGPFGRSALVTWDRDAESDDARPRVMLVSGDRVSAIETAPDGRHFLAVSDAQSAADGRLLLVDPGATRPTGDLGGPRDNLTTLRVAPDGRLLSGGPAGWFAWTIDPVAWGQRACEIVARELSAAEWRDALGDEAQVPACAATEEAAVPSPTPGG
jgi:WD40 repeat protein